VLPTVRVRLVDVPVALFCAADQHTNDLLREVALVAAARPDLERGHLFTEMLTAAERDLHRPAVRRRLADSIDAARRAGLEHVTVELDADAQIVEKVLAWEALLRRFDALSREERLLTLPADEDIRAYRTWYVSELVEQVGTGRPPTSWKKNHRPLAAAAR
jgi:hypothetical protein